MSLAGWGEPVKPGSPPWSLRITGGMTLKMISFEEAKNFIHSPEILEITSKR